ncbi:TetR family transcriptional regulator [Elstera litoralis]|uniref:TetR family transcriptional regulator n=1 Tax=Elstera litoralis TaxID=552518 RepID=A0A0F3ISW1_9PROT|nr:TetR family transcriptional regulator [Elstera litoralis]
MEPKKPKRDVRQASLAEAKAIIADVGLEHLSLREVARRLGISHQAPYKHFPSRDHLLAEIVAQTFAEFAAYLDAVPRAGDPHADLASLGVAYLNYAARYPLDYRLMFGSTLPDPSTHPAMMHHARHAFDVLLSALARLPERSACSDAVRTQDALFIWSSLHGFAMMTQTRALETVALPPDSLSEAPASLLMRIG